MDQISHSENHTTERLETASSIEQSIQPMQWLHKMERNLGLFFGSCTQPEQTLSTNELGTDYDEIVPIKIICAYDNQRTGTIKQILSFYGTILLLEFDNPPDLSQPIMIDGVGYFHFGPRPFDTVDDPYFVFPIKGKYKLLVDVTYLPNPRRPNGRVRLMNVMCKMGRTVCWIIHRQLLMKPRSRVFTVNVDYILNAMSDFTRDGQLLPIEPELTPVFFSAKEGQKCSVCLIEYTNGTRLLKLMCGHLYHEECIITWLRMQDTCPLCRMELCQREFTLAKLDERESFYRVILSQDDENNLN